MSFQLSLQRVLTRSWIITLIASFLHEAIRLERWSVTITSFDRCWTTIKNHQIDGIPKIWQHQALPCLIFKILQSRFKKLVIWQKQALLCLIFKIWRSRFRKMLIRQNQTWPYIISKIWWSTFIEIPDKISPGPFLFPKFDWVDFKRW